MFFHFNSTVASYFSSAAIRDYFQILNNIAHKGMYLTIKYLKNKSKFLYIGSQTLYSKNLLSEKEKNIERFKKSFFNKKKNLYKTYIDISYLMES